MGCMGAICCICCSKSRERSLHTPFICAVFVISSGLRRNSNTADQNSKLDKHFGCPLRQSNLFTRGDGSVPQQFTSFTVSFLLLLFLAPAQAFSKTCDELLKPAQAYQLQSRHLMITWPVTLKGFFLI